MSLRVVEYFNSIQGEGKYMGRYSFFIRLAGCNLNCEGFGVKLKSPKTGEILNGCDTIRAVKTSHFSYNNFDAKELINLVKSIESRPMIVITGGEPLLWREDENLNIFLTWSIKQGYEVHFETNGTLCPNFDKFENYKLCNFAISPKLNISNEPKHKRLNPNALKEIFKNANAFYKFVITGNEIDEINEILDIQKGEVWCMPLAKNKEELEKNAEFVTKFCLKYGFNYSDRIHIRLWNDKDGV